MIDRQGGDLVFECDSCNEVLESGTSDFNSVWNRAKREGWRAKKLGNDWVHACPQCNEEN